jgi:hypothetical protein
MKDLSNLKGKDLVTLKCEMCGQNFTAKYKYVKAVLKGTTKTKLKYCSKALAYEAMDFTN